ncbi:MAG TPA: SCO family protein [Solirubrobacteraceae bacterium]|jgi:protein SCO1/2|nr:SCO family protein [Solirubrobacteraceae bacterium]
MRTRLGHAPLALALALALATVVIVVLAVVAIVSVSGTHGPTRTTTSVSSSTSTAGQESGFDGAALPGGVSARGFTLSDQYGHQVSLSDYRGRVVVLTFLYSRCGGACVLIAQQIRGALNELEEEHARAPAVLIVSADPAADSRARVRGFLAEVSLTGRVEYLTGPLRELREIWAAYRIKPASVGAREFDEYASVLLLDRSGRERVLFQSENLTPEFLSHDIGKLNGP